MHAMTALEELDLGSNALWRIPNEVFSLRSLRTLIASDNRILEIPSAISRLTNLRELNCSSHTHHMILRVGLLTLTQLSRLSGNTDYGFVTQKVLRILRHRGVRITK
jgi:internalin A